MREFRSFVALGDSFTEGVGDPSDDGVGCRGWADRFAEDLARQHPGLRYANLAIRGKLAGEVLDEQVPAAIALRPDLVSLAAGGNDMLRFRTDPDELAVTFETAVAKLAAAGCTVMAFTGFDPKAFPVLRLIRGKAAVFSMHVREIASKYDCLLADLWPMRALTDRRLWSSDRLHLSADGHRRVALLASEVAGLPVAADWRAPLACQPVRPGLTGAAHSWLTARWSDVEWVTEHAAPYISRRVHGVSAGDGIGPKRPQLTPAWAAETPMAIGTAGQDAAAPAAQAVAARLCSANGVDLSLSAAELTQELVDAESVSHDEGPLADAIEAALGSLPHLSVHREGNAIVARTELGRPQRVVLAGHIDTVPIADNVPSKIEDGTLYGCGSSDMKSGVAVQLELAARVAGPSMDVTYVFYDCEEIESEHNGLLRLSRRVPELLRGEFAILLEPTGGVVEGGCQGTLRAEVRAEGKRAHSARSWMGRNAIHEAAGILDVLRAYEAREPEVDGLRYHEGLNAVLVRGGVAGNVIPDECVVTVNFRFAPDRSAEQAVGYVREVFAGWEVTIVDVAGGARPGLQAPAAASFVAAMGGEPRAKLGWTDVARFDALGIPAVNYGPGDPMLAHTKDEHVALQAVTDCAAKMTTWLS